MRPSTTEFPTCVLARPPGQRRLRSQPRGRSRLHRPAPRPSRPRERRNHPHRAVVAGKASRRNIPALPNRRFSFPTSTSAPIPRFRPPRYLLLDEWRRTRIKSVAAKCIFAKRTEIPESDTRLIPPFSHFPKELARRNEPTPARKHVRRSSIAAALTLE